MSVWNHEFNPVNQCTDAPSVCETIKRISFSIVSCFLNVTDNKKEDENDKLRNIRLIMYYVSFKYSKMNLFSENIYL